eukprot:6433514-Amphidinium_carterae.1
MSLLAPQYSKITEVHKLGNSTGDSEPLQAQGQCVLTTFCSLDDVLLFVFLGVHCVQMSKWTRVALQTRKTGVVQTLFARKNSDLVSPPIEHS